jgi:hypothetical protein
LKEFVFPYSSEMDINEPLWSSNDLKVYSEMIAETGSLLRSASFRNVLVGSFESSFDHFLCVLKNEALSDNQNSLPLAKWFSPVSKAFEVMLPQTPSPPHVFEEAISSASTALPCNKSLLDILHNLVQVREFCSFIYYPLDYKLEKKLYPELTLAKEGIPGNDLMMNSSNIAKSLPHVMSLPGFDSR